MASKKPATETAAATGEDDLLSTKAAKPAKPAKANAAKPAKPAKPAADAEAGDDLLSTKPKGKAAAKPAAKAATKPAAKTAKAAKPAADAEAGDDLLDTKPKGKAKPAAKGKAAAADKPAKEKKPAAPRPKVGEDGTVGTRDDVRAILLKTRKSTSFADIASTNNFNVRMVRRCARQLKAEGLVEITRDGTTGMVRKIVQPAA